MPIRVQLDFHTTAGFAGRHEVVITEGPGRVKLRVNDLLPGVAHATVVRGLSADGTQPAPIVVERTLFWGAGVEGHASPGQASLRNAAVFAEGAHGGLATFAAVFNPNATAELLNVYWAQEGGTTYHVQASVAAGARLTLTAPGWLPAGSYGLIVATASGRPIAVERMVYGGASWTLGHAGTEGFAPSHFFAEGSTQSFYDTFLSLYNTNASAVPVTVYYVRTGQILATQSVTLSPGQRWTSLVDQVPGVGATAFQTHVHSGNGLAIGADLVLYWPGVVGGAGAQGAGALSESESSKGADPPPERLAYAEVVEGMPADDRARAAYEAWVAAGRPPRAMSGAETLSGGGWYGSHLTTGGQQW